MFHYHQQNIMDFLNKNIATSMVTSFVTGQC